MFRLRALISDGVPGYQAALANLLDAVLFHASAAAALGDDAALELADWACRRLLYLNTAAHAFAAVPGVDLIQLSQGPSQHSYLINAS